MNFQQFLLILKARYRIGLALLGFTVLTTLVVSLLLPKQYTATASVVVDVKSPDPIMGMVLPGMISPGYMATQVDIIQSDKVARKVVTTLKIDQNPAAQTQWLEETKGRGTIESWFAGILQKQLDVKPSRESNVIQISYKANDPKFAEIVANAFAKAYIDTNIDLRVEPAKQYATWFEARGKQLKESLEAAQAKLSAYQRDNGIVAIDERLDVESNRFAELSSQLVGAQTQRADTQSREAQIRGGTESLPEVLQNPLVGGLKADVARNEAKLELLSKQLGRNHPQYLQLDAETAALRERVQAEIKRVVSGLGVSNRINVNKEAEIKATLARQKEKLLDLKHKRDEMIGLQRDVDVAQKAYDVVSQRLTQSNLESQSNQTNIAVLTPASEPLAASSPRIFLNVALSVLLGTMLAIAGVLVVEMLDRRVRSSLDVQATLSLPVLAEIERNPIGNSSGLSSLRRLFARSPSPSPSVA